MKSFTCPKCERTSHHPMDVLEQYCGACHEWFNDYGKYGPHWYDRAGNRITMKMWGELREDVHYCRVASTYVGKTRVSTVWLGLDHSFLGDKPLIFETMVVKPRDMAGPWRWPTESMARTGHDLIVLETMMSGSRRMKKAAYKWSGVTYRDERTADHFRVRSRFVNPFSNPTPLSPAGRVVSRKYHARKNKQ